jgi:hypothetical protein
MAHNAFVEQANQKYPSVNLKDRWFDAEFQSRRSSSIEGRQFTPTFPVMCPNLGPEVYAALYGSELVFGDVTSCRSHWSASGKTPMG